MYIVEHTIEKWQGNVVFCVMALCFEFEQQPVLSLTGLR